MENHEMSAAQSPLVDGQIKGKPKKTLSPGFVQRLPLKKPLDVAIARTTVRKLADELGYSLIDQVRLSTAIFEVTDNIVTHAGQGEIDIYWREDTQHRGLQFFCNDQGLHASKLTTALYQHSLQPNGYASALSLKNLVDEFEFTEDYKDGNCVTMAIWLE
ncbi:MAG: hypothetical protein JXM69_02390 [Anaerolineae bacterium]|nr:hypothetical protein [Anaerolineae bacterium]